MNSTLLTTQSLFGQKVSTCNYASERGFQHVEESELKKIKDTINIDGYSFESKIPFVKHNLESHSQYPTIGKMDIEQYTSLFPSLKTSEHIYIQCSIHQNENHEQQIHYSKNLEGLFQCIQEVEQIRIQLNMYISQEDVQKTVQYKELFANQMNERDQLLCELINDESLKREFLNDLNEKMKEYSQTQCFEEAVLYRDIRNTIESIHDNHFNDKSVIDKITKRFIELITKK